MKHNFFRYIKAVGTGKKHNYDLSRTQMCEAMDMILTNQAYPEQISAFLLGWRLKPETVEEFCGVLDSFDKFIKKTTVPHSIELGYPFDGKKNNPYLFSLIAKYLEPFGINIVITTDLLQPSKEGVTIKQILPYIDKPKNLYTFDRADMFEELHNLTQIRDRLGTRTGLNGIERLINPANSDTAFLGVFHKPFMRRYVQIFQERYKKLIIIKGNEGTSEIFAKTQYWITQNNQTVEYKIDPKDFDINYQRSWERISLSEMVDAINKPSKELVKLAKLNSAVILYSCNKVKSIEEGYEIIN